jgi:hypothetical protein
LELGWFVVGILAGAAFVDLLEQLSAFRFIAEVVEEEV